MPDRIRLIGLVANGVLCATFGLFALFILPEGQAGMATFFALVAATGAFNWHVIRKSARVLAEQTALHDDLRRQLAQFHASGAPQPPPHNPGPAP